MQLTHCLPTKNLSWTPRVHHRRHSPPTSAVRFAPIFPAVTVSPPKHQKTHSMPPEKQEVFKSMENWATENVLPLLKPVKDCWQPQTFLPDPALPLEEFNDKVKELRERMAELPDDYFVVLVGDMITEEALPTYQTMINTLDGVKDETGASSSPWAVWTRAWTAEENRHGDLLRNYLYLSGRVNMFMIERTLQYLVGAGMDPGTENNPYLGFVYTSFQERATFVSHGTPLIVGKLLEIDPTGAMLAIGDMMKKKITMPAHLMFDGEDPRLFEHFAAVAQRIGVYTSDDYADIVEALNERWGLEKLEGLRDEGRRAQEFVCNLAPRIRKLQERAEESAKKMGPQAVKFSWIFNREITL
ncbi:hypothetical protein ES319_D05G284800v1 [Gossypium barbadense]|uniref:stearoyl-[acyl-carrier-protein] 9-desaturase n=1 Tax=Gossypium barbadense TaxID=3634 RepID=A0A5J5RIK0_GOSBA|nr:hypothetical protein ES319_D05G284800v1 [Gossypium barbadense]